MLLAKKDEAEIILDNEQNDFLLADASKMEELEDLNVIYHEQPKIVKPTIDDDQINSDIIFDDLNVEVNDGQVEQDNNDHDQRNAETEWMIKNVQIEAEKHKRFLKSEDKYLDDILDLEGNIKANENMVVKMSNSLQAIHMLGPTPISFYDQSLKNGLSYKNPYTLKKAIVQNPKLYDASSLYDSKIHVVIYDIEEIL
ncbi:hypothetical protein Tco_1406994 [Tanacetum coccineum]